MSNFGKNVYKYRKLAGLTQDELAQILGYKNKASIGKIETGVAEVPVSMALKIADALHVDVMELLHGEPRGMRSDEFIPYLETAEDWKLEAVRKILDMPTKKEASSDSTKEIV